MTARTLWVALALAVTAILIAFGYGRLRLDMDLFSLLPADSPQAQGLELYQQAFGSAQELVISVRATDAATAGTAAGSLAEAIQAAGLSRQVLWQNPIHDRQQLAPLVAFEWLNQPPQRFRALTERLDAGHLQATLDETLERLASSLDPQQVARLARDPYGLTEVLNAMPALPTSSERDGDPLVSADGRFRIVLVAPPFERAGFARLKRWTDQIRDRVQTWQAQRGAAAPVQLKITGNPALVAESGAGLLRDIAWSATGTLAVVIVLFWLAHRSWRPLLRLAAALVAVLGLTLGLGGLLLGRINIVSLGFAGILLGLAADYGLILHQELRSHPERSRAQHRAAAAPSVLWAAATTAGAFFMLTRSSLPGVAQLGVLVGIGMLTAAAVMLVGFLGPARAGATPAPDPGDRHDPADRSDPADRHDAQPAERFRWARRLQWSTRSAWGTTFAAAALVLAVLLSLGTPAVDYAADALGFRRAPARDALMEVGQEVGRRSDSLWIIVAGSGVGDVSGRLARTESMLQAAQAKGVLARYVLPGAVWPNPAFQRANRARLDALIERRQAALADAGDSGFTQDALGLTAAVFDAWQRMAASDGVIWPQGEGVEWILREFSAERDGRPLVLGRAAPGASGNDAALAALGRDLERESGARLIGWSLLSDSLLGTVQRDVERVVLPMLGVLLVLLAVAFRRAREIVLSLAVLALSGASLLALMAVAGWSWNLMNVMALALLLGTGVDYSIHVQYALRRYHGEAAPVRRSVGRAILLCGVSTAAGFGTLGFASNAGLASLGRVCAAGILIACLISVYLLPAWWRALMPDRPAAAD